MITPTFVALGPQYFVVTSDIVDSSHSLTIEFDACLSSTVRPSTPVAIMMSTEYSSAAVDGRLYVCSSQYDCQKTSAVVTTAVCFLSSSSVLS